MLNQYIKFIHTRHLFFYFPLVVPPSPKKNVKKKKEKQWKVSQSQKRVLKASTPWQLSPVSASTQSISPSNLAEPLRFSSPTPGEPGLHACSAEKPFERTEFTSPWEISIGLGVSVLMTETMVSEILIAPPPLQMTPPLRQPPPLNPRKKSPKRLRRRPSLSLISLLRFLPGYLFSSLSVIYIHRYFYKYLCEDYLFYFFFNGIMDLA